MRLTSCSAGGGARGSRAKVLCVVSTALLLLLACGATYAQSGRRAPRASGSAQASDESSASPTPTPAPSGPKRDLKGVTLLVAVEMKGGATVPAQVIFDNFAVHLANAGAKVNSLGVSKREAAVRRAQSETEAYVVWLQLEKDSFQNGQVVVNSPDLAVKYNVFEPRTGESKSKGKVFYQAMAGPRGRSGSSDPVKITAEAAGVEAADQVIDWFMLVRNQPRR